VTTTAGVAVLHGEVHEHVAAPTEKPVVEVTVPETVVAEQDKQTGGE